ncbi:hypothetical protein F7P69_20415 [Cellulosimicrobium funkei]|nr:hypothetical protein [Cellulosimicrobium funkei]
MVFLVVLAYATVAALQILVWNPLAAVPGRELAQIRSSMAAADEDLHIAPVVGVLGFGVVLTAVLLIFMLRGRAASFNVGLLGLGLLALGAVAYFWASFNAGMSLADAFGISGGDYAPWGGVLTRVSAAALVVFVAASAWRGLRAGVRRR